MAFVVIEAAFLGLVLFCSRNPIIIALPLPSVEVKGGFTMIFILWQTVATFILSEATALAFSSEWSLQHTRTGHLIPGITDRVSRLTSGTDDNIRYFLTGQPSTTFRTAFLVSVILTALNSVAPSTLSVSRVKTKVETPLEVADLADLHSLSPTQYGDNDNSFDLLLGRASVLTNMELQEDSIFKYNLEPNWVMAWPDERSIDSGVMGVLEYPTNVVHFNNSCSWEVPTMELQDNSTTWIVNNQSWVLWGRPKPDMIYRGGRALEFSSDYISDDEQGFSHCIEM